MVGGMKTAEIRTARLLFLFGSGNGERILNPARLAELVGCHAESIRKYLPAWEAEAENILANSAQNGLGLRIKHGDLEKHESDKAFFRRQIDSQVAEIQALPKLESTLLDAVRKIANCVDSDMAETAISMLRAYFDTVGSRKAAEAHLIKLQSHWTKMAGIESLQAVAETREKTLATGRAKLDLKREAAADAPGPESAKPAGAVVGGVFAKRGSPVVDVSDDEV